MQQQDLVAELRGATPDPYQPKVEQVYADPPELWQKVIGNELWFQFGVYDDAPEGTLTLDEAGRRYLDGQLELAGIGTADRVLDIGFGWGAGLAHLAEAFPHALLDGVNISRPQYEFTARRVAAAGCADRVRLYLGNARDIEELPESEHAYDLALLRGVITHFSYDTTEATMTALATRMRRGGMLVISENLYNVPLDEYVSAIPDEVDRLACGYRKSPGYLTEVLHRSGFVVRDLRQLPSNEEAVRWSTELRENIDRHFPNGDAPLPVRQLREHTENWAVALRADRVSVYSIVAERA